MVQSAVGWLCSNCGHVAAAKPAKPVKAKAVKSSASGPSAPIPQTVADPPEPSSPGDSDAAAETTLKSAPETTPDPTAPKSDVHVGTKRRRWRTILLAALVLLAALGALFYFGYYAPARAAWKQFNQRLGASHSAHYAGTFEFEGQQFLSALNSNLKFEGEYDKSQPGKLVVGTKFDGLWAAQRYDGQAAVDGRNLYFKVDGPVRPVIRYSQSNFLYPLTPAWHKTPLDDSLYSNYCETRDGFKAPTGLFWIQTARSIKFRTSPLLNPWARLNGNRAVHFKGTVDTVSLVEAIDKINSSLPSSCGLAIAGSDLAKAKVSYDFWTGSDFDRLVLRLEDNSLGATATLTLQSGLYGQAQKVDLPAAAVDLGQIRVEQQALLNRDQDRRADIESVQAALTAYYNANRQRYPAGLSALAPRYLPSLPADPKTGQAYVYSTTNSRRAYSLSASLEEPGAGTLTVNGP
jgi:hypothetical protein